MEFDPSPPPVPPRRSPRGRAGAQATSSAGGWMVFAGVLLCQQWPERERKNTLHRVMAEEGVLAQPLVVPEEAFVPVRDRDWNR